MNINIYIKKLINHLFVQKEVDFNDSLVLAAIITAGASMANYSNIVTKEKTIDTLLAVYDVKELVEVEQSIGLIGPQFIKNIIGFSVDFENNAHAQMAYIANQEKYNDLYQSIKVIQLLNEQRKF